VQQLRSALLIGCLTSSAIAPAAHAVDFVPFVGYRFGGIIGTQNLGALGPTSVSVDSAVSYGGVIDIPFAQSRAVELYYSHQPTSLSTDSHAPPPIHDVSMDVLHVGVAETLPSADEHLSWLLVGTLGATELSGGGSSATRFSVGLGGGFVWMATQHVGLRGDLRGLFTFGGTGGGSIYCGGGCAVSMSGSLIAQGEVSLGLVARF
jgi:hypothetical protein